MGLKEDFLRIYSKIPIPLRDEIVLVYENNPLTWNVINLEVKNNTKLSETLLKKLKELGLL
jgi:hypothetical protein